MWKHGTYSQKGVTVGIFILVLVLIGYITVSRDSEGMTRHTAASGSGMRAQAASSSLGHAYVGSDTCVSGYLENFPAICGADGCLPVLPARRRSSEVPAIPDATRKRLLGTIGFMGPANIDMVWYFTRAQRAFGVYGSVGEIGVFHGRYSSVMAYWMDTDAGERLFACDLFSGRKFKNLKTVRGSQKDKYEENLRFLNLSFYHEDETRRIRLFQDTSVKLSKAAILDLDLPAFRMFSIDGGHLHPVPILDLLFTSCVSRDGAVITMDDTHGRNHPHVAQALKQFFTYFGTKIWRPFILVGKKLYLVQTSWYDKYHEWFEKHGVFGKFDNIEKEEDPDKLFGTDFTYYKIPLKPGEIRVVKV